MKAFLMHRDRDFDLLQELPSNELALTQDLELDTLFLAMAGDDKFLYEVTRKTLLTGLRNDLDTIRYRQAILRILYAIRRRSGASTISPSKRSRTNANTGSGLSATILARSWPAHSNC